VEEHTVRRIRTALVTLLLAAVTVRVLWWTVEPLVPYLIGGLGLVTVFGVIFYRKFKW